MSTNKLAESVMHTAHRWEVAPRTCDVSIDEKISFASLLLSDAVLRGLKLSGFERPSPIQLKAIPLGRCGFDLVVQAKSGTGKTCVFAVIALESVDVSCSTTQVVILAPTREIAVQIQEVIRAIGCSITELHCHTFIGGLPVADDIAKLKKCHIAVGTPGRMKQLIENSAFNPESVRLFVLDEADKLMETDFQDDINWIYSTLPNNKQMLTLSATYPESLARHITNYMRSPMFVRLNVVDPALLGVLQYCKTLPFHPIVQQVFDAKFKVLIELLSSVDFNQCLVFTNYQMRAHSLCDRLGVAGWPAACISAAQDQKDRLKAVSQLKQFQCRILISTDLTSRGIDAENVNLVVNFDIPRDHETYLHRVGRAGRFGTFGTAVSLVSGDQESRLLREIEKQCNTAVSSLPEPIPADLARHSGSVPLDLLVTAEQLSTENVELVTASNEESSTKTDDDDKDNCEQQQNEQNADVLDKMNEESIVASVENSGANDNDAALLLSPSKRDFSDPSEMNNISSRSLLMCLVEDINCPPCTADVPMTNLAANLGKFWQEYVTRDSVSVDENVSFADIVADHSRCVEKFASRSLTDNNNPADRDFDAGNSRVRELDHRENGDDELWKLVSRFLTCSTYDYSSRRMKSASLLWPMPKDKHGNVITSDGNPEELLANLKQESSPNQRKSLECATVSSSDQINQLRKTSELEHTTLTSRKAYSQKELLNLQDTNLPLSQEIIKRIDEMHLKRMEEATKPPWWKSRVAQSKAKNSDSNSTSVRLHRNVDSEIRPSASELSTSVAEELLPVPSVQAADADSSSRPHQNNGRMESASCELPQYISCDQICVTAETSEQVIVKPDDELYEKLSSIVVTSPATAESASCKLPETLSLSKPALNSVTETSEDFAARCQNASSLLSGLYTVNQQFSRQNNAAGSAEVSNGNVASEARHETVEEKRPVKISDEDFDKRILSSYIAANMREKPSANSDFSVDKPVTSNNCDVMCQGFFDQTQPRVVLGSSINGSQCREDEGMQSANTSTSCSVGLERNCDYGPAEAAVMDGNLHQHQKGRSDHRKRGSQQKSRQNSFPYNSCYDHFASFYPWSTYSWPGYGHETSYLMGAYDSWRQMFEYYSSVCHWLDFAEENERFTQLWQQQYTYIREMSRAYTDANRQPSKK